MSTVAVAGHVPKKRIGIGASLKAADFLAIARVAAAQVAVFEGDKERTLERSSPRPPPAAPTWSCCLSWS